MKRIIFVFLLFVITICQSIKAQFILVNDPLLASALCTKAPSTMSPDCLSLDTIAAASFTGLLQMQYYGFTDVTPLRYFKQISGWQTVDNNISSLPDLTGFSNLNFIDLRGNPWSNFAQLAPVQNQLQTVLFRRVAPGSSVKDFSFLNNYPNLQSIQFSNFNAEILPDFSLFSGISNIKINNNRLSFSDLLPLTNLPNYTSILDVMPQNNLTKDTIITAFLTTEFSLEIPIDVGISGITYEFYKNSSLLQSSSSNKFYIANFSIQDTGTYQVLIKSNHPFFVGSSLQTGNYKIETSSCPLINNIELSIEEACDQIPLEVKGINFQSNYPIDSIFIFDKIRNLNYPLLLGSPQKVPTGVYDLYFKDDNGCEYFYSNYITLKLADKCSDVFSPNGDGITDIFFIDGNDTAVIRNKQGIIMREVNLPGYWDGNDKNGNPVNIGLYSISFSNNEVRKVTVLR